MAYSLESIYDNLISGHEEQNKQFIDGSDLMNTDGSINAEHIKLAAGYDSQQLISALSAETIGFLVYRMATSMRQNEWEQLAGLLCLHFYVANERLPVLFAVLMAHDEAFQAYCKSFYNCLC